MSDINSQYSGVFEELLTNYGDIVYSRNIITETFDYLSESIKETLGYSQEDFSSFRDADILALIHENDKNIVTESINNAIKLSNKEQIFRIQYRIKNAKREFVTLEDRFKIVKDSKNKPIKLIGILRDISIEVKRTNSLELSEANLKAILNNTMQLFVLINRQYKIVSINKTVKKYYREIFSKEVYVGDNILDLTLPEQTDSFKSHFEKTFSGEAVNVSTSMPSINKKMYFNFNFSPIVEENGIIENVVFSAVDITDQRETELEVIKSNSMYKLLAESSFELVCQHYPDGTYKYVSPSVKKLLGYSPSDLEGTNPYELFHPDDKERVLSSAHIKLFESDDKDYPSVKYRIRKKDGKYIWFRTYSEVILDEYNELELIITRSRDITDEVKADFFLKRNERLLQASGEVAKLGVWEYDIRRDELYWSDVCRDLHGVSKDYVPSTSKAISFYEGESRNTIETVFQKAMINGKSYDVDLKLKTAKNSVIWVRTIGIPEFRNAKCIRVYGTFQDITKQKSTELELRKKEDQLLQLNKTKDKMLSVISHDIRSPLSSLIGLCNLISVELKSGNPQNVNGYITMISSTVENSLDLLSDILQWTRSQTGFLKSFPSEVDLKTFLNQTSRIISSTALEKNINISVEGEEVIPLEVDKVLLETVIRNLLSNAIKFTNRGKSIKLKYFSADSGVVIKIIDEGVGMDKETVSNLFEPKGVMSNPGTENEKGSGMGLIIVKEFMEKLNGKVHLESEVGKGTEFILELPLHSKGIVTKFNEN